MNCFREKKKNSSHASFIALGRIRTQYFKFLNNAIRHFDKDTGKLLLAIINNIVWLSLESLTCAFAAGPKMQGSGTELQKSHSATVYAISQHDNSSKCDTDKLEQQQQIFKTFQLREGGGKNSIWASSDSPKRQHPDNIVKI